MGCTVNRCGSGRPGEARVGVRRELEFGEGWKIENWSSKFFFKIYFFFKIFGIEVGNPGVVSVGVGVSSTLGAT